MTKLGGRRVARAVTTPVPRLVRWAAYAVPLCVLPSVLWRIPLLVSGPPGCPDYQYSPGEGAYILALSVLSEGAALLTIGLVRPWGEVFPRWIPVIGGRRVPVRATVAVAGTGAAFVTAVTWFAAVNYIFRLGPAWVPGAPCTLPTAGTKQLALVAGYAPLLAWGPLLAAVTVSYYRRRTRAAEPA